MISFLKSCINFSIFTLNVIFDIFVTTWFVVAIFAYYDAKSRELSTSDALSFAFISIPIGIMRLACNAVLGIEVTEYISELE